MICEKHENKCNFFCYTCQQIVCATCSVLDHEVIDHECYRLDSSDLRRKLRKALANNINRYEGNMSEDQSVNALNSQEFQRQIRHEIDFSFDKLLHDIEYNRE